MRAFDILTITYLHTGSGVDKQLKQGA